MENVSHLFLFKGKLQTKSQSPPKTWSPQQCRTQCHKYASPLELGALAKPAHLLILLLQSVQKQVAPNFCAYN